VAEPIAEAAEPRRAFTGSRRLPGANRFHGRPSVVLSALGPAAGRPAAHEQWAAHVQALAAALGWPRPEPLAHAHAGGLLLAFAAPAARLYTATEVNEWAWEQAVGLPAHHAADAGDADPRPWEREHPPHDVQAAARHFAARAAAEANAALDALMDAAAARGVPLLIDDEVLSVGEGARHAAWPIDALPGPAEVPWDRLASVPKALITGSNGKTTTVRLVAAMCRDAGHATGFCCTEGVYVGAATRPEPGQGGDWSGPAGARAVLRDPRVQAAVLETARGGLLRRGLAVARAEVAVVTNISPDHVGEYGIDSAADIADVKLVVAHAVHAAGTLVLNGEDALLLERAGAAPHAQGRRALFGLHHDAPPLAAHRAAGGATCGVAARGPGDTERMPATAHLLLSPGGGAAPHDLGAVAAMPIALGGAARHNVANAAAAALAAWALGVAPASIARTLRHFGAEPGENRGRMERHAWRGATVMIDYAHNPEGLALLLEVARHVAAEAGPEARLLLLLGQAGNRDDAAIAALARTAAAFAPHLVVLKELPAMRRGRAEGEVPALLEAGLRTAGFDAARIEHLPDEAAAAHHLLGTARPGDVVVLPLHAGPAREQVLATLAAART
jgi:UDP-N-acetylmuramyl tripeptide synthase